MSQFLICKSKEKMTEYGFKLDEITLNKDFYINVINKYFHNDKINDIWIIDKIHDIVNSLKCNLKIIEEISQKSEWMIFWYGMEYDGLDRINSSHALMEYLRENINNPCLEIYLLVDLSNKNT